MALRIAIWGGCASLQWSLTLCLSLLLHLLLLNWLRQSLLYQCLLCQGVLHQGLLSAGWMQDDVSMLFDLIDTNKDGRVTKEEFIAFKASPWTGQ